MTGEFIYPVGSQLNPEVIWDLSEINVAIADGNSQGYYYSFYNRAATGTVSLSVASATEGVEYDVILTNMSDYSMAWLQETADGTVPMDVSAGDQVINQVVTMPDALCKYPEAEIALSVEFPYPVCPQTNPEALWDLPELNVDLP